MSKPQIHIFDFDGTLTTHDTLLEFIRYAKGTQRFVIGFLLHAPLLVLMKLHLYPNYKAKEKIFTYFFSGMPIGEFNQTCLAFANKTHDRLLRPQGREAVCSALEQGHRVLVVSASIDNWVRPFLTIIANGLPHTTPHTIGLLGTQIETANSIVTGRFSTPNCYGAEKIRRINQALGLPRQHYHIVAYGDSRGDKEMLTFADEAHYKPFRP